MGNSQDVCLLYVLDDVTDVTIEYDTERNFDFLDWEYSGARSGGYTG
jgi:hypothetical protein